MLRHNLIADLTEYSNRSNEAVLSMMNRAAQNAADKWQRGEREQFYKKHKDYVFELTHWHTQFDYRLKWTEQILEFATRMKLHRVLDYGCGIGTDGLSLAELGMDVDLFDVGEEVKRFVKWKITKYGLSSARLIDDPRDDYDITVMCDVIGHLENPVETIVSLAQRTRYLFYTEDFNIGVAAYPMHHNKPVNFDRVFRKAFRGIGGYFYESRLIRPKVQIVPTLKQLAGSEGGVKRRVEAMYRHLPAFGIDVVESDPDMADCHAVALHPKMLVHSNHGFYNWYDRDATAVGANLKLKQAISLARRTLVVSDLAQREFGPFLKVSATKIPNGVTLADIDRVPQGHFASTWHIPQPYLLWAKMHTNGVCDPGPALRLAAKMPGVQFVFTVVPPGRIPDNVRVVGVLPHEQMLEALQDCAVLLATTKENFSIQTLEVMACGKPVLCFNDGGGNAEAVTHRVTGYIAQDEADLYRGALFCLGNAGSLGANARKRVEEHYQWDRIMPQIVKVYKEALLEDLTQEAIGPLVSIVIPAYNAAETIGELLESIQQQTLKDYEVIVVDDASTDNTQKVVECYGNVRYFKHLTNTNVAGARNTGIRHARGKYVTCIDADDKIKPTFLERLSRTLEEDNTIAIAYPDFELFGDAKGIQRTAEYDFERLKRGNFIPHCAMFRRFAWERVGGQKDINPSWEDYEFWLNLGKHGFYGKRVPEALFLYRKRRGQGRDYASQSVAYRLRGVVNSHHPDLYPPIVSVVIPCYNHAHYLKDSIKSVLEQSYQQFEIIVVDDGSENPDEVPSVVSKIGDPRIRVIRHDTNKGLAAARNTGVQASVGPFILPLDADDMIKPLFLEKTLNFLNERADVDIAYTDVELFGAVSQVVEMPEYDFELMLKKNLMLCTSLYRREVFFDVGGYDPRMNIAWEDYLFWIRAGKLGHCGARIDEPLFMYRRDRQSMIIKAQDRIAEVQQRLYELEPQLFKEGRRPPMCCGRRSGTAASRNIRTSSTTPVSTGGVGDAELVAVIYDGGPVPALRVKGLVTGAYYELPAGQVRYVDARDALKLLETGLVRVV